MLGCCWNDWLFDLGEHILMFFASYAQFFAMHDMRTVSLAAGGEMRDYELVAYVAKDVSGMRGDHSCRPFVTDRMPRV